MAQRYKALKGTRDILPDEVPGWHFLEATTHDIFSRYGFQEIRTPVFESTSLFTRSVGESTDIVRKEMYTLERSKESLTLRPENTAPVVRAFVEHALHRGAAAGFPARYYYIGPMFRHERPQKGRQRQFHQIGAEVLGATEPLADAETIQMLDALLEALGIDDRELVLNSVGDGHCRPRFREALTTWLAPRVESMCEDCRRRYRENPLRVFDCKVDEDQELLREAPAILDVLCEGCEAHFSEVRNALDRYEVAYRVDKRLVRGLDYYRRTVFEVVSSGLGAQNAILGGGRYDGLVRELGGPDLPGFGFAMGMERTILLLGEDVTGRAEVDVALISLGREGWEACIGMARRFRAAGLRTATSLVERPMGAQLKRADRVGARYVAFVGADELAAGRFGLKEMRTGEQRTLTESEILETVGERDVR